MKHTKVPVSMQNSREDKLSLPFWHPSKYGQKFCSSCGAHSKMTVLGIFLDISL